MTTDLDFYDLLGVSADASEEEIRKGFRRQVREYHPDLNDDPRARAQFTALKKAYDTLADPKERDAYDRMGHEKYVKKRISGLPSPEDWQVPEGDGESSAEDRDETDTDGDDRETTDRSETTRSRTDPEATDRSKTRDRRSASKRDRKRTGRERNSESGGSTTTDSRTESSDRTGAARDESRDRSLGRDARSGTRSEGTTATTGVDRSQSRGTTGAGTARDPDATPPGGKDADGESDTEEATTEGVGVGDRIRGGVDTLVTSMFGWPMIVAADALFLTSMGLYAAENAAGIERLVERVRTAGLDVDALGSALASRPEGLESLSAFIVSEVTSPMPAVGFLVLVGIAFLPSVYFFLVRWTRKNRLPWQPSYLYVVGALAPVAGLLVSGTIDPGGVYVEVFLYFLVPVSTIFGMLFFGQIKPRMKRVYRRWRYRIEG